MVKFILIKKSTPKIHKALRKEKRKKLMGGLTQGIRKSIRKLLHGCNQ